MNIYAIGDIHGCLSDLTSLHKKILTNDKFNVKEDLLTDWKSEINIVVQEESQQ